MGRADGKYKIYRSLSEKEKNEKLNPDVMPKVLQSQRLLPIQEISLTSHAHINTTYKEGIDVSHYQGLIDWQQVGQEAQVSYVYIKATEGQSFVDKRYRYNIVQARQAGLSVGSYHFYRPRVSPYEQFENMVTNIRKEEQDLVPMIDVETTGNVSNEELVAGLEELAILLTQYYGKKPLIYTYQNFYNKHLVGALPGHEWMIAKYKDEAPVLTDNLPYMMWQYTQTGRIPGIKGKVDRSRLMGESVLSRLQL